MECHGCKEAIGVEFEVCTLTYCTINICINALDLAACAYSSACAVAILEIVSRAIVLQFCDRTVFIVSRVQATNALNPCSVNNRGRNKELCRSSSIIKIAVIAIATCRKRTTCKCQNCKVIKNFSHKLYIFYSPRLPERAN